MEKKLARHADTYDADGQIFLFTFNNHPSDDWFQSTGR